MHRVAGGALVLWLGGCVLSPIDIADRRCPCTEGWVCDERRDRCVPAAGDVDGGCSGGPDCSGIVPSNVAGSVAFSDSSTVLEAGDGELWIIDSDDGSIEVRADGSTRSMRAPGAGTIDGIRYEQVSSGDSSVRDYGVFAIGGLRVAPTARLVAAPGSRRALVLISAGDVIIDGEVSVSGSGAGPGPGGGAGGAPSDLEGRPGRGGSGGLGGVPGPNGEDGGGGGGGLGSAGAPGGAAGLGTAAAGGGTRCTESLVPLCGGAGGGAGADNDGGRGGNGGGALQITSASSIVVRGHVDASGEGGQGGIARLGLVDTGAGGGGGSGGAILLEAMTVTITGRVTALGGAGGQGAMCNDCGSSGADGATYDATTAPPAPGTSTSGAGGGGGAGADEIGSAGPGLASENAGGGGGGAGRIRIHTAVGDEVYDGTRLYPTITSRLATVAAAALVTR